MTTPVYWVPGGNGNWNSTTNWSASSGGGSGANVPTSSISAIFDGNSGSGTATINVSSAVLGLNFTGFTGTLAGSSDLLVFGNFIGANTFTNNYTGQITISNTASITSGGMVFLNDIIVNAAGTVSLQDALVIITQVLILTAGTFNTNNHNIICGQIVPNGASVNLGSSIINCTSSSAAFAYNSGTINAGTSLITFTANTSSVIDFRGGGATYYNFYVNTIGSGLTIIQNSNIFNQIQITAARTVKFTAGTTQTFSSLSINGTAGNNTIVGSTTPGSAYNWNGNGNTYNLSHVTISDCHATNGTFNADSTCVNGGGNTGINFPIPKNPSMSGARPVITSGIMPLVAIASCNFMKYYGY